MEMIINIPKETYEALVINQYCGSKSDLKNIIVNGIPLPKGHGRLIDANNLKHAFIMWSMAVQGLFTDANIASIIDNSPTVIEGSESE